MRVTCASAQASSAANRASGPIAAPLAVVGGSCPRARRPPTLRDQVGRRSRRPAGSRRAVVPGARPATREACVDDLVALSADLPAARAALDVSERQDDEIARNRVLRSRGRRRRCAATPASSTTRSTPARCTPGARRRLAVCSALFGLVMGTDPIPAYRLSSGSTLPGRGGLRTVWRPVLGPVLAGLDDARGRPAPRRLHGPRARAPARRRWTWCRKPPTGRGPRSATRTSRSRAGPPGCSPRRGAARRTRPGCGRCCADAGLRVEQADETSLLLVVPR